MGYYGDSKITKQMAELLRDADRNTAKKCITDYEDALLDNAEYLLSKGVMMPPINLGDTFWGVNSTSYDAYCVYGFKWGKRKGSDETILYVITTYDMEFIWGEEAFATEEEAKEELKKKGE